MGLQPHPYHPAAGYCEHKALVSDLEGFWSSQATNIRQGTIMRFIWLGILILSLSGVACGEDKKRKGRSSSSSSDDETDTKKDTGAVAQEENAETPEFTKQDSDELREEKFGNGQNKAQGHVRRDASDNYVRVGPWKFWHRNGSVKESGSYAAGKKQGRWESWHSNGQKESERHYKLDQEHGTFSIWKKSGQLRETGAHQDGKKHGIWKRWYKSNAQQEYERQYVSGAKTGRWI